MRSKHIEDRFICCGKCLLVNRLDRKMKHLRCEGERSRHYGDGCRHGVDFQEFLALIPTKKDMEETR